MYTNTNAAPLGEWHLYGVLTPCKSLRRLSLGTGMDRYSLAGCHALPFTSNTKRYSIQDDDGRVPTELKRNLWKFIEFNDNLH